MSGYRPLLTFKPVRPNDRITIENRRFADLVIGNAVPATAFRE